ncbi:hypothetical protein C8J55DRAFT_552194 [Lentinula edodes]|uniref:Uncharacterized protein n=1 Tax=Lentinula lateritia TaxID=40482 RepID=A0A9W8ZU83_9AGAR|nr:hypothetical protein C8J55DRAFT_552194 [Lentinula edodes]
MAPAYSPLGSLSELTGSSWLASAVKMKTAGVFSAFIGNSCACLTGKIRGTGRIGANEREMTYSSHQSPIRSLIVTVTGDVSFPVVRYPTIDPSQRPRGCGASIPVPLSRGTAGENSLVEKRNNDEQEFANNWFGQLHDEDWIDYSYDLKCAGYGKNEEIFKRSDLTNQIADRKLLSKFWKFNQGVFTLPNHLDRVVKLVRLTIVSPWLESTSCEVESLKAYEQDVTSGFAMLPPSEGNAQVGVIIMKKVDGTTFLNTERWTSIVLTKKQKVDDLDMLKKEVEEMIYSSMSE